MILVTGATGGIGRRVVRLLRQQQQPVRSFVRLTSHYSELEHRGSDIFIGDLQREQDIEKACRGIKYIISTHGSGNNALSLDYRANIELIDQAKVQGVEHFVFISVLGADRGYEDAPVFKAKRAVERYLQSSGLDYTILRPAGLASNLLPLAERFRETGLYLLIGDPKNRTSIVSTDDLAKIIVDSLTVADARNQILPIGGAEILLREDIPKIFSRIFNKEPIIINVPLFAIDGLRSALGLLNSQAQTALGTFRTLLANEFFCTLEETANVERIFNFQLETLETFLRRYLAI
ncbi:SDR family oxidoreductase [Anabaena cylindrica FACHB-243]|uniref:3-beta hydroxysteroid dehydrogenase/isomerase n=1 Tax=Anabaena cylindrica (strain ATCC 27899 / PCC 7122) TaxID=272123 RepID=K9ZNH3_ANACC|nr:MULTISPECIES: SDR family oxidoreductase [Anabaena]AFZ60102.1 3-beta hydroxysteroid dehydrogenase/isomerase [Anabaena cylindrica PCC 7122]MBD2417842.1 SDR family oxidoreductase [Anabaena cylindrica FACHB-243]MBY5283737.1 SDR family oxidoreductase [Anabaena sp. CCAP 1446/1C]MBY5308930.1 SDR family oxidoreductase [Anabaena sp. CCAP 1446/1C]MCM2404757.1 SDR family oxidoreductase [Anabaena sp. CCAP 1446/1C]